MKWLNFLAFPAEAFPPSPLATVIKERRLGFPAEALAKAGLHYDE